MNLNPGVVSAAAIILVVGIGGFTLIHRPHVVQARPVPRPPIYVLPQPTPPPLGASTPSDQKNRIIFASSQEAQSALISPDPKRSQSGLEALGSLVSLGGDTRTTIRLNGKDVEVPYHSEVWGRDDLVPALTRSMRNFPGDDGVQAARLLAQVGPSARPAIPAICEALSEHGNNDELLMREDVAASLTSLCGGASEVAPVLARLLQAPSPQTRRSAAAALAFRMNLTANRPVGELNDLYLPPGVQQQRRQDYNRLVIPALAARAADSDHAVRVAALRSLRALAYGSDTAPWGKALPLLAGALSAPDAETRQEAAHTLAVIPADLSPIAPALRGALGTADALAHAYVFVSLMHAAQLNRASVLNCFLKPLASPNLAQRRAAAADISQAVAPLWDGQFWPEIAPTDDYYNSDAEGINLSVWMPPYAGRASSASQAATAARWSIANDAAQDQLLAALVLALSDHDASVRTNSAASLETIGRWTNAILGHGGAFRHGQRVQAQVVAALTQAAAAVQGDDPAQSQRLQDLASRISRPHDRA